jgi:hypothetical protein
MNVNSSCSETKLLNFHGYTDCIGIENEVSRVILTGHGGGRFDIGPGEFLVPAGTHAFSEFWELSDFPTPAPDQALDLTSLNF